MFVTFDYVSLPLWVVVIMIVALAVDTAYMMFGDLAARVIAEKKLKKKEKKNESKSKK